MTFRLNGSNPTFLTIMDEEDITSQLTSPASEEQSNFPTSSRNNLRYANPDTYTRTSMEDLTGNSNVHLTHSIQEFEPDIMCSEILILDSEQDPSGDYAVREMNRQVIPLNNDVGRNCFSIVNTRMLLDNCLTTDTRSNFETTGLLTISNLGNENHDFSTATRTIESSISNLILTDSSSEGHHKQSTIKRIGTILEDNGDIGCRDYQMNDACKEEFIINTEKRCLNIELAMQGDKEMQVTDFKRAEINRQFSKYRQNTRGRLLEDHLSNTTHALSTKETEKDQQLNVFHTYAEKSAQDSGTSTGSFDTIVGWKKSNVKEKVPECQIESFKNKFDLNNEISDAAQKVSTTKGISKHGRSESGVPSCSRVGELTLKIVRSRKSTKQDNKVHADKREFICNICQKVFRRNSNFKSHMILHTGEKPHKCNICGRCFARKGNLTDHMNVHTNERPYLCDICGRSFARRVYLTDHMNIHTNERPYKCNICEKSFTQSGALCRHKRIHMGYKSHKCVVCGKSMKTKQNLDIHMFTHYKNTSVEQGLLLGNDKLFKCDN